MMTGQNFIGSKRSAEGQITFRTIDPKRNAENGWEVTEATENEVDQAAELAWTAFKDYRKVAPERRAEFLEAIAEELEAISVELTAVYCQESGLPEGRAANERGRTVFQLRNFAAMLRKGDWIETAHQAAQSDDAPKPDLRKTYIPMGPVAVFGSSNFPLAYSTAGGDTASALAVGCPVVVKSHPMHAGTGELVAGAIIRAAEKTGMPNGVFSNLNSRGIEVGVNLVKHAHIKAVGFTGSIRGGRALFDLANQRDEPIPVFAEMGSINPVIISQGALENKANDWAEAYAASITLGAGQFCTNPGLIIAETSTELDAFIELLSDKIQQIDPLCMLHPSIHKAYTGLKQEVSAQVGVSVATGDIEVPANHADQAIAVVDGATFIANPKLHQEVFGPFSLVVKCANRTEILQIIEGLEGQLTGTIIAEQNEINGLQDLVDELQQRVGRITFNSVPTGVEVCPAMQHGGPYPASTDARFTAVGVHAVKRWIRPVSFQNFPVELLPEELK